MMQELKLMQGAATQFACEAIPFSSFAPKCSVPAAPKSIHTSGCVASGGACLPKTSISVALAEWGVGGKIAGRNGGQGCNTGRAVLVPMRRQMQQCSAVHQQQDVVLVVGVASA